MVVDDDAIRGVNAERVGLVVTTRGAILWIRVAVGLFVGRKVRGGPFTCSFLHLSLNLLMKAKRVIHYVGLFVAVSRACKLLVKPPLISQTHSCLRFRGDDNGESDDKRQYGSQD